MSEENI